VKYVLILVIAIVVSGVTGALLFPRRVVITVEKPGEVQTHTVYVRDSVGPFPVIRDTVWLHEHGIPVPPIPKEPQPQMVYGLSFTNRNLSLSIRQMLAGQPRYRQEVWTGLRPNFSVAWDTVGGQWSVTSWPDTGNVIAQPVAKRWSAWRPTVEAGLTWYPGSEVVATVAPGILMIGHLKVGAVGELSLAKLRTQQWSSTRVGLTAQIVW